MFSRLSTSQLFRPKNKYSLEHLKYLHALLVRNIEVHEGNKELLVETLRSIAEILIWGDQNDNRVFDVFLENNMLFYFLKILNQNTGRYVKVQMLQTLSILFENISNETALYYLLSNNHINAIIVHKFDFSDEEVLAYYISFLKTLSLKLNKSTIHFFYNEHLSDFPLYTEAVKFFNHSESMARIAVRTITLNIYRVGSDQVLDFILGRQAVPYFSNVIWFIANQSVELDELSGCGLSNRASSGTFAPAGGIQNGGVGVLAGSVGAKSNAVSSQHQRRGQLNELVCEHVDHFQYFSDVLALNIEQVNVVVCRHLMNKLLLPLYIYSLKEEISGDTDLKERASTSVTGVGSSIGVKERDTRLSISPIVAMMLLSQVFYVTTDKALVTELAACILRRENDENLGGLDLEDSLQGSGTDDENTSQEVMENNVKKGNGEDTDSDGRITRPCESNPSSYREVLLDYLLLEKNDDTRPLMASILLYTIIESRGIHKKLFELVEFCPQRLTKSKSRRLIDKLTARLSCVSMREQSVTQNPKPDDNLCEITGTNCSPQADSLQTSKIEDIGSGHIDALEVSKDSLNDSSLGLEETEMLNTSEASRSEADKAKSISELFRTSDPKLKCPYNEKLINNLLDGLEKAVNRSVSVRIATFDVFCGLLKSAVYFESDGPCLLPHHAYQLSSIKSDAQKRLQLMREECCPDEDQFMEYFEYEQTLLRPLNIEHLITDCSILLPHSSAMSFSLDFYKRLPEGETEVLKLTIRMFCSILLLWNDLCGEECDELLGSGIWPSSCEDQLFISQVIDLSKYF